MPHTSYPNILKICLILSLFMLGLDGFSQNQNAKAVIEVDGVCEMCKERIEKACLKTKGVKMAIWNTETHQLKLIYNERKTRLKIIQENIAAAGHDTPLVKATDTVYDELHACCKYREPKE